MTDIEWAAMNINKIQERHLEFDTNTQTHRHTDTPHYVRDNCSNRLRAGDTT